MNENFGTELREVADVLASCDAVKRFDAANEKEAWTLAHDFLDIAGSCRTFVDEQLPRLRSGDLKPDDVTDLLLDIGEEFRHIVYHIRNSRFYRYLGEESGDSTS